MGIKYDIKKTPGGDWQVLEVQDDDCYNMLPPEAMARLEEACSYSYMCIPLPELSKEELIIVAFMGWESFRRLAGYLHPTTIIEYTPVTVEMVLNEYLRGLSKEEGK